MTTATFKLSGNELEVDISGHSLFSRNGPDIVCASCSTLAYTLCQAVSALHAEGAMDSLSCRIDDRDGYFHIQGGISEAGRERIDETVRTIMGGYALLQKKYPENVKLEVISGEK